MAEIPFFLKYGEDIKKVICAVDSLETLHAVFDEKFPEASQEGVSFYVKDRQYGVVHKLEEVGNDEVYEGCVIEVRSSGDKKDLKRELDEVKRKLTEMESGKRLKPNAVDKPAFIRNLEDDGMRWVQLRGLPWEVTKDQIKQFFEGLDYLDDSIHILTNAQGQATGDAFVQFADDDNLTRAEERNKNNIGSRYIEVYKVTQEIKDRAVARSKPWNPSGREGGANGPVSTSSVVVKLRGLPFSAVEGEIKDFLVQELDSNSILAVHMSSDHIGRPSGEAFIELTGEEVAEQALKLNKQNMGRRYIDVMRSSISEMTQAMAGRGGLIAATSGVNSNAFVVKMRGLPFSCSEQDIRDFFKGIPIVNITQTRDFMGRPSGEAFVEVASDEALADAMKLNKQHIGSRYIDLFRSSATEMVATQERGGPGGGMGFGSGGGPLAGVGRPDPARGYGQGVPAGEIGTHCLRMQGIPFSCSEGEITRFFQDARVTPVRMHRKAQGGEAYVEFANEAEARQALSLHKMYIGHRYIELHPVLYNDMAAIVGLPPAPQPHAAYNAGYGNDHGYGGGGYGGGGYSGGGGGGGGYGGGYGGYGGY